MTQPAKQTQKGPSRFIPLSKLRSALKQLAHVALFPATEAVNVALLKIASRIWTTNARKLVFTGEDRVLVLAPHPDDETLGCGGALGLHLLAGDALRVIIVTDGRRSRASSLDSESMVALRVKEAQDAMEVLQQFADASMNLPSQQGELKLLQFMLPEGGWTEKELIEQLGRQLREWKPTIVYTTSCVDFHPDHLRVAHAFARALQCHPGTTMPWRIRAYELQVALTPVLANVFADIKTTNAAKVEALAQYRTQAGSFMWVRRYSRYLQAIFKARGPIEVFWEMDTTQFIAVHITHKASSGFRSIRLRPCTDLAAWMVGTKTRRVLRDIANKGQRSGD